MSIDTGKATKQGRGNPVTYLSNVEIKKLGDSMPLPFIVL